MTTQTKKIYYINENNKINRTKNECKYSARKMGQFRYHMKDAAPRLQKNFNGGFVVF